MTNHEQAVEEVKRRLPGDEQFWAQNGAMRVARVLHGLPAGATLGFEVAISRNLRELVTRADLCGYVESTTPAGRVIDAGVIFGVTVGLIAGDAKFSEWEGGAPVFGWKKNRSQKTVEDVTRWPPRKQLSEWARVRGTRVAGVLRSLSGLAPRVVFVIADSVRELIPPEDWRAHLEQFTKRGRKAVPTAIIFGILNNPHIMGHWTGGLAGVLDDIEGTLPELMDGLLLGDLRDDLPPLDEVAGGGLTDPNATPEPPDEASTKPGDLYILGKHRLISGDCTDAKTVQRLMKDERATLFATDPPYLVGYDGMGHPHTWKNKDWTGTYGKVHWDESEASPDLYDKAIGVAKEHAITDRAAWYWWHASRNQAMVEAVWEKHGAFVHQQIIWVKDRPILSRSWYMWRHEPCFFGWMKGKKPRRVARGYPHTVWEIPKTKPFVSTEHPTSKPVEVFQIPIQQHTRPGDICYEPFAGSGSQFIAAEQLSRRCYGLEIEPRYGDVIVRRWEEFTGKKAKLLRTGQETG